MIVHWGIIESRPLLRGRVRTLSIAPEGLALLEHRYPHESGRIVDVAGLEEVASFHIGGRGVSATLRIALKGEGRKEWVIDGIPRSQVPYIRELLASYIASAQRRSTQPFTHRCELESLHEHLRTCLSDPMRGIPDALDLLLLQGVHHGASDVHFELSDDVALVRYRIDDVLHDAVQISPPTHTALLNRLKVVAQLALHQHDTPQEGHFTIAAGDREVDARVTILPTIQGEKATVRLFDPHRCPRRIEELGMSDSVCEQVKQLLNEPHGAILLTGPANSGKTTTMYAALLHIHEHRSGMVSIATIEDPIERMLSYAHQTQVEPARGLTYAIGLRTILRQDPNVIMVGEVRDSETADMVIRASLTGHLVLSTVHAGRAAEALLRLLEMGIAPYLLASSVTAVIAQRLVRVTCQHCAHRYQPEPELLNRLGIETDGEFRKGAGCQQCHHTGYFGRTGIFEVMSISRAIRELILRRASIDALEEQARREGMRTLLDDARMKVLAGVTTLEEVIRVLGA